MFAEKVSGVALSNFSQVLNEQINVNQILLAALHSRYCARNNQAAHIVGGKCGPWIRFLNVLRLSKSATFEYTLAFEPLISTFLAIILPYVVLLGPPFTLIVPLGAYNIHTHTPEPPLNVMSPVAA